MDWNSPIGMVLALASGMLIISVIFWVGQAIMTSLGDEPPGHASAATPDEQAPELRRWLSGAPARRGEERLASQLERDEVNHIAEKPRPVAAPKPAP